MKKIILVYTIVLGLMTAGIVYATATQSGNFPTSLNTFQDGDVINAGDWNAIESTIGITNSSDINSMDYMARHVSIAHYGTGTSSSPTLQGQLLGAYGSGSWGVVNLVAGSNITITTSTPGQITIISSGGTPGTVSGGTTGYVTTWASSTSLTIGTLRDNGTVSGVNATSSTISFNIQGSGTLNPFNVASSSGTSYLTVAANGSTTLSSLVAGVVRSTSGGSLFNGLISNADILNGTIDLTAKVTGILPTANGGTGTTTLADLLVGSNLSVSGGQKVLIGTTTTISLGANVATTGNLVAGSNITITTSTPGQIVIAASAGSISGGVPGKNAYWASPSTLGVGAMFDNGTVSGVNATSSTISFNVQGSGVLNPFNVSSSSGTSLFVVNQSGNVGIGYNNPVASLYIARSTNPGLVLRSDDEAALGGFIDLVEGDGIFGVDNAGFRIMYNGETNKLQILGAILTNSSTLISIDRFGGKTGFGTTTPSALLTLQGTSGSTANLFTAASSSGASIFNITSSGLILTNGTVPTTATSTGIGSAAGTATLTQADSISGLVTFNSGATPAANATIVTITFPVPWANAPNCTLTRATSSPTSAFDIWATTTTSTLLIKSTATAIPASSQTAAYYHCFSH